MPLLAIELPALGLAVFGKLTLHQGPGRPGIFLSKVFRRKAAVEDASRRTVEMHTPKTIHCIGETSAKKWLRRLALCLACWGCALPASAQAAALDLDQAIEGFPGIRHLDAVRLIAPGAGQANRSPWADGQPPLRHISGDMGSALDAPREIGRGVVSVRRVASAGRSRLLLLLDLGYAAEGAEGYAVLALIDPGAGPSSSQPRLLDAANVAYDRSTAFFPPGALRVGAKEHVALVASSHFNSSQSYQTIAMIGLHGDRLRLIDTVFTLGDTACGYQRTQSPRFTARGDAIRVQVTEAVRHTHPACQGERRPAARKRSVAAEYRWNPGTGTYVRSSGALEQLAQETARRF